MAPAVARTGSIGPATTPAAAGSATLPECDVPGAHRAPAYPSAAAGSRIVSQPSERARWQVGLSGRTSTIMP